VEVIAEGLTERVPEALPKTLLGGALEVVPKALPEETAVNTSEALPESLEATPGETLEGLGEGMSKVPLEELPEGPVSRGLEDCPELAVTGAVLEEKELSALEEMPLTDLSDEIAPEAKVVPPDKVTLQCELTTPLGGVALPLSGSASETLSSPVAVLVTTGPPGDTDEGKLV